MLRYLKTLVNSNLDIDNNRNSISHDSSGTEKKLCIFGDFEELHDRIAGRNGDFKEKISQISKAVNFGDKFRIVICLSIYNFARLNKIAEFCISVLGKQIDLSSISLDLFPVKKIPENFVSYVEGVKKKIGVEKLDIIFYDDKLMEVLDKIGSCAQAAPDRERDLLRLLGVISEQVFIGPQTIVFDPYHRCNSKCQHCWVHTPGVKHPEEFLERKFDFEIFKRTIDDAAEMMVDGIILQGDGEPLMYENFMPMLRYARNKGMAILFITNGILLDKEKAKEIINLGVNEIYCSFPAGTAETYHKVCSIQPLETFYRVWNNLKSLIDLKRKLYKDKPRLVISHVIHTMNYRELEEMAKMDVDISPDAVRFYLIRLDVMNRFLQLSPEQVEEIKRMVPRIAKILKENNIEFIDNFEFQLNNYDNETGAWSKNFFLNHGCTIGWYFNLIPAKYDMSFCCHLRTVGYLNQKSFKEIWNSVEYWRWRKQAKHLKENKNTKFLNGQVLYDEHCDHCDNHQTLIRNLNDLHNLGLHNFF